MQVNFHLHRSIHMLTRLSVVLLVLVLVLTSCMPPNQIGMIPAAPAAPGAQPVRPILVQAPADATATPTPFLPLPPTPTYVPTAFPTSTPTEVPLTPTPEGSSYIAKNWEDYPGPTIWPDIDIPAPVGLLPQPAGQINIVLLGSDQRRDQPGLRTDTILLLTLNPRDGTASLTSFPRDLYVYIPGWTVQRINTAFPHGGFSTLQMTMEYNFGVRPDYYVMINFWSFVEVIDSIGGISVQVGRNLTDQRDGYGQYSVRAGTVQMDGETALWYARSRSSSNDFDRTRRQQEVIKAIFAKMMSLDAVTRAPQLFDAYKRNVTTNLTFDAAAPLLPVALQLRDTANLRQYFIGPAQVVNWRNTQGAAVLLPIRESVLEIMRQALNSE
jgi:polyisoprenyl-teichoic acid--peptidoglycan teichoic acid transferase